MAGSALESLKKTLWTGDVQKAVICVRNIHVEGGTDWDKTVGSAADIQKKLMQEVEKNLKKSTGILGNIKQLFTNKRSTVSFKEVKEITGKEYIAVEVQFNPNSISFETQDSGPRTISSQSAGSPYYQIIEPVSTTISFQLIFDQVTPLETFMLDSLTVGNLAKAGINKGVDAVKALKNKVAPNNDEAAAAAKFHDKSVETQMDGFLALLAMAQTRQVIFFWSEMCFRGELTRVNNQYTVFNPDGKPVRGVMNLTIRQEQDNTTDTKKPKAQYDEDYWRKQFEKNFSTGKPKGRSTASKILSNNFLNF